MEYQDQQSVERIIMENIAARFHLTECTPAMQEPLLSDLGYLGDTDAAQCILEGTYVCPPEVDDYTHALIDGHQRASNIAVDDMIDTNITKEDFQAYWKKAKECTSSSISGLHFGHYKAASHNSTLSEMHAVFANIAVNLGFSPMQWQWGLTAMLEKKAGLILVTKLWAILLMEADFNFSNKLIYGR
jgi:hypothetical protein